jgi:hypothetical protein
MRTANHVGQRKSSEEIAHLPPLSTVRYVSAHKKNTRCVLSISVVDPDPHQFGNLDLHQIKIMIWSRIRIRIKVISWIQNRIWISINLQMTSQNVWHMSLIEHFFKALSLYLVARIWIQICIRVKSRIRIRINKKIRISITSKSGSASNKNQNPDPHKGEKANPDPHQLS